MIIDCSIKIKMYISSMYKNKLNQPMILLSIFDDIIVKKEINIQPIYVESCFKFSIISYKC